MSRKNERADDPKIIDGLVVDLYESIHARLRNLPEHLRLLVDMEGTYVLRNHKGHTSVEIPEKDFHLLRVVDTKGNSYPPEPDKSIQGTLVMNIGDKIVELAKSGNKSSDQPYLVHQVSEKEKDFAINVLIAIINSKLRYKANMCPSPRAVVELYLDPRKTSRFQATSGRLEETIAMARAATEVLDTNLSLQEGVKQRIRLTVGRRHNLSSFVLGLIDEYREGTIDSEYIDEHALHIFNSLVSTNSLILTKEQKENATPDFAIESVKHVVRCFYDEIEAGLSIDLEYLRLLEEEKGLKENLFKYNKEIVELSKEVEENSDLPLLVNDFYNAIFSDFEQDVIDLLRKGGYQWNYVKIDTRLSKRFLQLNILDKDFRLEWFYANYPEAT